MAGRDPETHPAAFLGAELRRARVAAGFSSQESLQAAVIFDLVRSDALPRVPSRTLILEAAEQWKNQ
jgi:hypothetical protein